MITRTVAFIIFCLITSVGTHALAQSRSTSATKKKTAINFDDQLVTGDLRKPELFYLMQKKQFNFGRLIKLRENFLPEMRKAAEDIKRGSN